MTINERHSRAMKDDFPCAANDEPGLSVEKDSTRAGSLPKWPIFVLLALAVMIPAIFWQRVWFGANLSDEEIRRRLTEPNEARQVQHACEQISRRMQNDPENATQFYDLLVPLAAHPNEDIRYVVAWCMGEDDTRCAPFRKALLQLAEDESPRVRYNAALGLARFGDSASRPILQAMLKPHPVSVQWEGNIAKGTIVDLLAKQHVVRPRTQLALLDTGEAEARPILAPLPGRIGQVTVSAGQNIRKGETLCTIKPNFQQIFETLRALVLVGEIDDLPFVEPHLDPESGFSQTERAHIRTQAQLTSNAIRERHKQQADQ